MANAISFSAVQALVARIDREVAGIEALNNLSARTGIPRAYLVLGGAFLAFFFVFVGFGAAFFSTLIGFLYPAYASFKAIESKDVRDDTQWLTYWVVFAAFSILECFTDILLYWFPFYYTVKIAALLYCQLPQFNGAAFLYTQFVRPWFEKNAPVIESQFAHFRATSGNIVRDAIGYNPLTEEPPSAAPKGKGATVVALPPDELFGESRPPTADETAKKTE